LLEKLQSNAEVIVADGFVVAVLVFAAVLNALSNRAND
jgi:hypothetical protein